MRKVVYTCDECEKHVSGTKHLSLHFAGPSGVAIPPENDGGIYRVVRDGIAGRVLQFCNAQCVSRYMAKRLKEAE